MKELRQYIESRIELCNSRITLDSPEYMTGGHDANWLPKASDMAEWEARRDELVSVLALIYEPLLK